DVQTETSLITHDSYPRSAWLAGPPAIGLPGAHSLTRPSNGPELTALSPTPSATFPRGTGPAASPSLPIDASHWKKPCTPVLHPASALVVRSTADTCGRNAVTDLSRLAE